MRLPHPLLAYLQKKQALRLRSEKEGFGAIWEGHWVGWRDAGIRCERPLLGELLIIWALLLSGLSHMEQAILKQKMFAFTAPSVWWSFLALTYSFSTQFFYKCFCMQTLLPTPLDGSQLNCISRLFIIGLLFIFFFLTAYALVSLILRLLHTFS